MVQEYRERFTRHPLQRKSLGSDSGVHHGTYVTYVSWCMSGSLTRSGREIAHGIPGTWHSKLYASGKRPIGFWSSFTLQAIRNLFGEYSRCQNVYHVHKDHGCWQCQTSCQRRDIVAQLHTNPLHLWGPEIRIWNTFLLKYINLAGVNILFIWLESYENVTKINFPWGIFF